ncbi:hypothetical protein B0H14DRAFT_3459352 [Mycena olivaceomarginata]|nr:hypothetical protein B0H14DRAFT_3459352 [Mycena olivaceomarginata]
MERKFLFVPFMPFFDLLPSLPPLYPPPTFLHTHPRPLPHISAAPSVFVIPLSTGNLFRIPFTLSPPSSPHYPLVTFPPLLLTLYLHPSPTISFLPSLPAFLTEHTFHPFSSSPVHLCPVKALLPPPTLILYTSRNPSLIPPLPAFFMERKILFTPLSSFFDLLPSLPSLYPSFRPPHIHPIPLPHALPALTSLSVRRWMKIAFHFTFALFRHLTATTRPIPRFYLPIYIATNILLPMPLSHLLPAPPLALLLPNFFLVPHPSPHPHPRCLFMPVCRPAPLALPVCAQCPARPPVVDPTALPKAVAKERPASKKSGVYAVRFFPAGD